MSRIDKSKVNGSNGSPAARNSFNETFRKIASASAAAVGSKWAFLLSIVIVAVWAATGPIFHFSDTWQPRVARHADQAG